MDPRSLGAEASSGEAPGAAAVAAAALAVTHIVTPALWFLRGIPRSVWLSLFGGVSVAYVFVHLLPELASGQEQLARAFGSGPVPGLDFAERHVYLVALAGLAAFYGLERMAKRDRAERSHRQVGGEPPTSPAVFWVHIGSFAAYNGLIGYLLVHRPVTTTSSLIFFAVAMALHFVVTDFGLDEHHGLRYRRIGRWVLVGAVGAGFWLGLAVRVSEAALAVLVAFLAGGVILNVLKEEIPAERQSRFWAFGLGLSVYAALLLAT